MIDLKYIVVGTGRCGSVYMARLLTSLSVPCSHEGVFNYKGLQFALDVIEQKIPLETSFCSTHDILREEIEIMPWLTEPIIAESSYMAVPYLDHEVLSNVKIIHILRNPLDVISSYVKDIKFFEEGEKYKEWKQFVLQHLPELNDIEDTVEKACYFYVKWNEMIESKIGSRQYLRYNVEDKCSKRLLDFLETDYNESFFKDDTINSWKKRDQNLFLEDIPSGKIKTMFIKTVRKYGYNLVLF